MTIERAPWEETDQWPKHGMVATVDDVYRWVLTRWFGELDLNGSPNHDRHLPVIMHNCSVAGDVKNDHTITKVCQFAKLAGYGGILVGNLYAYRSTDPKELLNVRDPVGLDNDVWLERIFEYADGRELLVAWGSLKAPLKELRIGVIAELAHRYSVTLKALKVSEKSGDPCHPLMLSYKCTMQPWSLP